MFKKARKQIHLMMFFILLSVHLYAADVFAGGKSLDASQLTQAPISLTEYIAVLEDPGATLTLSDIQAPSVASRFKTDQKPAETLNYGYTRSAYWLRLVLGNTSHHAIERMLEISESRLSNIQFYQPNADATYFVITTGMALPFTTRPYKNRFFVFPMSLPAQSERTYYLRIKSKSATNIPVKLWTPQAFQVHERNDYQVQAFYFGMVGAMVLFNLLLFVLLRDVIYLLYVNSCFSAALCMAGLNGLSKEFIFPDSTFWIDKTVPLLTSLFVIAFLFFMRCMLSIKTMIPKFDLLLKLLVGIHLIALPAMLAFGPSLPVMPLVILYLMTPVIILVVCLVCTLKKQRTAYILSIAFFMFLIGAVLQQLRTIGLLPSNFFTLNAVQVGSALEMILMAMALADRFNMVRQEKESAQLQLLDAQNRLVENLRASEQILEKRVLERTIELEIANEKLKALSTTDSLTGIANRHHFDNVFAIEWARAERQHQPLALAVLDVDWFKKYNDHYGHQMGDECLKNVAHVLAACVSRTGDLVARYGGEEFIFVAPATNADTALEMAKEICITLQASAVPHELSYFGCVTVSIGVAAVIPSKELKSENLFKAADEALYQAKEQGRNRAIIAQLNTLTY